MFTLYMQTLLKLKKKNMNFKFSQSFCFGVINLLHKQVIANHDSFTPKVITKLHNNSYILSRDGSSELQFPLCFVGGNLIQSDYKNENLMTHFATTPHLYSPAIGGSNA